MHLDCRPSQQKNCVWNSCFWMNECLFVLSLLFLFACRMWATDCNEHRMTNKDSDTHITFVILSEKTREPIIGATVRCEGAITPVVTDMNGRCIIIFKGSINKIKVDVTYVG